MSDENGLTLRKRLGGTEVGGSNLVRIGGIWIVAGAVALGAAAVIPSLTVFGAIGVVAALATLADIASSTAQPEPPESPDSDPMEELEEQGFKYLDEDVFEHQEVDREYCWRRPFTFTEIYAEKIPIDRQRPTDDRPSVTEELLADLDDGGGARLVGDPGSGKTTTTRQVATAWYRRDDAGPVVYRKEGSDPITDPTALATAATKLGAPDEPALVIVEDAARHGTIPFYAALPDLDSDDGVSVLVNARKREWERLDQRAAAHEAIDTTTDAGSDALETRFRYFEPHEMPPLDEREIERFVDQFEAETDRTVTADPADLLTQVRTEHGASQMLLLSYYLPIGELETDARASGLEANVEATYRRINGPDVDSRLLDGVDDERLLGDVALLVAVMTAAELPLYPDLLYAVGDDADAFRTVDQAVDALDSYLLFGRDDDGRLRSHHPVWAELYLAYHLETAESDSVARDQFELVVNGLFGLIDDESRRKAVREHVGRPTLQPNWIDTNTTRLADEFVRAVFEIGTERPSLAPLFATTEYSEISIPDVCSPEIKVENPLHRHQMYFDIGDQDLAIRELEKAADRVEEVDHQQRMQASIEESRGEVALRRGDLEEAREHYQQSIKLDRKLDNRQCEAMSLNNLGEVAHHRGNLDAAEEHLQESLTISREVGDRQGEAISLTNLGEVARERGNLDAAEEHLQESLTISREVGDRRAEAMSLTNLGKVARHRGNLDVAEEHLQESFTLFQEVGDHQGEATSLTNLGVVACQRGNLDAAEGHLQKSLTLFREIGGRQGEAMSLTILGEVVRQRGNLDVAEEHLQKSLTISREVGGRQGEAMSLNNLGEVARERGNLDAAEEHFQESLTLFREVGDRQREAISLNNLGAVARQRGDLETARSRFETAANHFINVGAMNHAEITLSYLIQVCEEMGNLEAARDWCERAIEVAEQADSEEMCQMFRQRVASLDDESANDEEKAT